MIPDTLLAELRARIDPVEIIGRRLALSKAGSSFVASCPFHADRTPSLRVFPDSKRFKCFGCDARGDAIDFLCRLDQKDFKTVVRELADELGITLPERRSSPAEEQARRGMQELARACEAASAHWSERLWSSAGEPARRYLQQRGVGEASARQFRLGFAPDEWHDLQAALHARGFSDTALVKAGLLREGSQKRPSFHDRFRGRVMFPLGDAEGRAVGFAGRALPSASVAAPGPKYLNGPETPLFHKGQLLYGLNQARSAIRSGRQAILVEGYFDAVVLHETGLRQTVAAGGTSISEGQVALLQRSGCEELVLLFDADAAGGQAPATAAPMLLESGLSVRVAQLPGALPHLDPDTFARAHGRPGLDATIAAAPPLTEWLLERAIAIRGARGAGRALSVEEKLLVVRDLAPLVRAMRAGLPRSLFEQRVARRLELYVVALRAELARAEDARRPASVAGQGRASCRA